MSVCGLYSLNMCGCKDIPTVTRGHLMIHGRIICRGTMGIAMRAMCSRGRPASIIFSPVTLSEAANAIWMSEKEDGGGESNLLSLLPQCGKDQEKIVIFT